MALQKLIGNCSWRRFLNGRKPIWKDLADFSDDLKESVQELIDRNYGK